MKTITISAIPISDVMCDLADKMNVQLKEHCDEYALEIPHEFGEGVIRGLDHEDGIGYIVYKIKLKSDLRLKFTKEEIHPLKMIYSIGDHITHYFDGSKKPHHLHRYESCIVGSIKTNGHILDFYGGSEIEIHSIEIERSRFLQKMGCITKLEDPTVKKLFIDEWASNLVYEQGNYSLAMYTLIQEMNEYKGDGLKRRLFLCAKNYEIISLHLEELNDVMNGHLMRKKDIISILDAVTFIEDNMNRSPKVSEIAEYAGVSIPKLQEGFKALYDTTVAQYIKNLRLVTARELLEEGKYNITEITQKLGIINRSYFTKLFREEYGINPKRYSMLKHKEEK